MPDEHVGRGARPADVPLVGEVAEAQADGPTRAIYQGIRALCGVPMVALIYRHLATIPGALEWAWAQLEPLLRDGSIQRVAWSLADGLDMPRAALLPEAALRVAGIDGTAQSGIVDVLDAYNRANPVNIVALRLLAKLLGGDGAITGVARAAADRGDSVRGAVAASAAEGAAAAPRWSPPAPLPALPPMIDPDAMDPNVRALAALLSDRGAPRTSPVLPSLYRHLANWPAALGYAAVQLPPMFDAIDVAAARLLAAADDAAGRLLPAAAHATVGRATDERAVASFRDRVQAAISAFSPRIPEMVVVGTMLRRAMPATTIPPSS